MHSSHSDILIIGGGIIGLATALELRLKGATVTVLSRDFKQAAGHAAAGMLAPQAEALPPGSLLELCLRSRDRYPAWIQQLETLTHLPTHYWPCGILVPLYETETAPLEVQRTSTRASSLTPAEWLDRESIHQFQAGLGAAVSGGWWFPKDAQVNNQSLMHSLWVAVTNLGVTILEGVSVQAIHDRDQRITHLETTAGCYQAAHYVLATGAWSQELLEIPVQPRKGQLLSVRVSDPVPALSDLPLTVVLFGTDAYIVPRQDGQIIIGATSEDVGFTPHNTAAGIQTLLTNAMRLFPVLKDCAIVESWWGFRPTTPDELPILGESPYANLTLATGHHRNGILLAPITADLVANSIWDQERDPLLAAFSYQRFRGLS
jgi:glycine oxidase ThiO